MEQSEKGKILSKIKQLAIKKKKHEIIIQKLLQNQQISTYRSPAASRSQLNIPESVSKAVVKIDDNFHASGEETDRSVTSCISSLSRQVNLQVYLSGKPLSNQGGSTETFVENNLQIGLRTLYGDAECSIAPSQFMAKRNMMISENLIDFSIIANFLQQNQLWEQIFFKKQDGYYAVMCPEFNFHRLDIVNLSKQKLSNQQKSLIIDCNRPQINLGSALNLETQKNLPYISNICIGYLLLYRLLSYLGNGFAPQIMQCLFGYPYKIYDIQDAQQYIELSQKQISKYSLILGESLMNQRLEKIQNQKILQLKNMVKLFRKLIIIQVQKDLCCKSIDVIHRRNHHSVVNLQNCNDTQITVFVSIFNNKTVYQKRQRKLISNFSSKCSISHGFQRRTQQNVFYRYCIVDQNDQILYFSSPFLNNKESLQIKLSANSQYKLYVSEVALEKFKDGQVDLCSFSINFQSQDSLQNLITQIKFNESYNVMTETLINKYLKRNSRIDEVEKQMIRLAEINPTSDLLIVRTTLKFMGLITDFISVRQHARRKQRNIYIQYQNKQVFCDKNYRENRKKLMVAAPQIHQINLSINSPIKQCSGLSFCFAQIFL